MLLIQVMNALPEGRNRRTVVASAVVVNLCALPLYWQQLSSWLLGVTPGLSGLYLALVFATILILLVSWCWWRSTLLGGSIQIILVLPIVVEIVMSYDGYQVLHRWRDIADLQLFLLLLIVVGIPATLLAVSAIVIWRVLHRKRGENVPPP